MFCLHQTDVDLIQKEMKLNIFKAKFIVSAFVFVFMLSGCEYLWQNDNAPIKYIRLKEEVPLNIDTSSPYCSFSIDFSYLNEKDDSIAGVINRAVQQQLLGDDYAKLTAEIAVDSFKNTFIRNYRQEVGPLYQQDPDPTLPWFNRTFELKTNFSDGKEGVVNLTADFYQYEGGAHPYTFSRWLNFDRASGRLLTAQEIFPTPMRKDVEEKLLRKLLMKEEVTSMESLRAKGYLHDTEMFIPDNFRLGKDSVAFLFNAYDIAPYAAGSTVLELGYDELTNP